jgi:hypothetical protein
MKLLALPPTFWKGVAVVVSAVLLFIGSIYILLTAYFGRVMAYLIVAVSLFGWMIILSLIWTFGAPGTTKNYGPRGTEPHWQVFAASARPISSRYPQTAKYPDPPWHEPDAVSEASADTVKTAIQTYLVQQVTQQFERQRNRTELDPEDFNVEDIEFGTASDGTHLAAGRGFYSLGGPVVNVFLYHDKGNVPAPSWGFLGASVFGFAVHLPLLDRAERRRKAILTGGAAPPWYGPA